MSINFLCSSLTSLIKCLNFGSDEMPAHKRTEMEKCVPKRAFFGDLNARRKLGTCSVKEAKINAMTG